MKQPVLENIETMYDSRYIKVHRMDFDNGVRYMNASRKTSEELTAPGSVPDAVTCCLVLDVKGRGPLLYLTREFRYVTGKYLLSPPAGLIDRNDMEMSSPVLSAAAREIREETGVTVKETDRLYIAAPLLYSSPGMTDESNAIAVAVVTLDDLSSLNHDSAERTECFDGCILLDREQALELLQRGCDDDGVPFSVYTWVVLAYFTGELYK